MKKAIILLPFLLLSMLANAQGVVDNKGSKRVADTTNDGWKNDVTNTQVTLAYNSDGTTVRQDTSGVVVKDNGWMGIGLINPSGILDIRGKMYVNNRQTIYNANALDNVNFANSLFVGSGGNNLAHTTGTEGQNNTAVGISALRSVTTGDNNTAMGTFALYYNTTGRYNTAIGTSALLNNTTGIWNMAQGIQSMTTNSTGSYNTAMGGQAMLFATNGTNNVAFGFRSLDRLTTGSFNTVIGGVSSADAAVRITTGSNNTFVGYSTGAGINTGGKNTILGANVTGLAAALSNNIILADGDGNQRIRVLADGKTGIGTTTPQKQLHVNGALQVTNELNVGGDATTEGSAGTSGQVLVSNGAGVAPSWKTTTAVSGLIAGVHYVQGTTAAAATAAGAAIDVPGVTDTVTVPVGQTQTLMFTVTGYAIGSGTTTAGQGSFTLLQNGVAISAAYTSFVGSSTGGLNNLPAGATLLKAVTLTAGTYVFKVQYKAWSGTSHIVNNNPAPGAGGINVAYTGGVAADAEAMRSKMQILIYNN